MEGGREGRREGGRGGAGGVGFGLCSLTSDGFDQ
jgi:hypothetical protein